MKLYKVTAQVVVMVLAPDAEDATKFAPKAVALDLDEVSKLDSVAVEEVTALEDVPPDWRVSVPWSADNHFHDETCEALLTRATCAP